MQVTRPLRALQTESNADEFPEGGLVQEGQLDYFTGVLRR
jgi:hypothetical protein